MTATRLMQRRSPCGKCCQDCRGLHSSFENYTTLDFYHVGIDATAITVPETPGGGRCVSFGLTPSSEFDQIYPVLTPQGGTPVQAGVIERRGLHAWIIDRASLVTYLETNGQAVTNPCNPCYGVWPWGVAELNAGFATASGRGYFGGDVPRGFLPACYSAADVPAYDPDWIYGPSHGSTFDHQLREWVENDWLLVVFDGDVEISDPEGPDPSSGAPDWNGSGVTEDKSFAPIFKRDGVWYARTFRIEAITEKLLTGNPRPLTKDTSEDTPETDRCLWRDEDYRAIFTWPGGIRPRDRDGYEDPTGSGVEYSPWDEYTNTWRKDWQFGAVRLYPFELEDFWNHGFPDLETDLQLNHFDGLFADDEASVIKPYRTSNENYDAAHDEEQLKYGAGGFRVVATNAGDAGTVSESRSRCLSLDVSPLTCSVFADPPSPGPEILQQFKMRRIREEDLERRQELFLTAGGNPASLILRSEGYEGWIGESPTGRTVILQVEGGYGTTAPNDPIFDHPGGYQLAYNLAKAPFYKYAIRWTLPDDDGVPVSVLSEFDSSPVGSPGTLLGSTSGVRVESCVSLIIRKNVAGTKRGIVSGAESDSIWVGAMFDQLGGDPLADPELMDPTTTWLTRAGDAGGGTFEGVEYFEIHSSYASIKFVVDSADYWVNMAHPTNTGCFPGLIPEGLSGRIRGLPVGSHTIELPILPGYYVRWWISGETCLYSCRQSIDNPLTFEVMDGQDVVLVFEIADTEFEEPDPPEEGPGGLVCEWPTTNDDPCGGYAMAMMPGTPEVLIEPFEAVDIEPEVLA
jgi:hypothetical protein